MNDTLQWMSRVALAIGLVVAAAPLAAQPYAYLPTGDVTDGRFLTLNNGISSFGDMISIAVGVPGDRPSFEIGVFDGDNGKDDLGNLVPAQGNWDLDSAEVRYCLYVDPATPAVVDPVADLVGCWHGNVAAPIMGAHWASSSPSASGANMPNNDWWSLTVGTTEAARAASGDFFYHLTAEVVAASVNAANFKIRSVGELSIIPAVWSIEASLRQPANDVPIVYPGFTGFPLGPTTYDGTWSFQFRVPYGIRVLGLWEGDGDFGTASANPLGVPSGDPFAACLDDDDPTTPAALPPWATAATNPEGASPPGNPADDITSDIFRRSPCVRYQLVDPLGNVYANDNPSGDQEWEEFQISSDPGVVADVHVGGVFLDGLWRLEISGLDINNTLALRSPVGICTGNCDLAPAGAGTPGYWKNHPEAWPVDGITLGGVSYTVDQAIAVMNARGGGDKSYDLFDQLVATTLNVLAGAEASCIVDTQQAADLWLVAYPVGSGVKANSAAWADGEPLTSTMDAYNNGDLCAPSRDLLGG
jgi:hypothetical protein